MEEVPFKLYPFKFITPTWKMLYERIKQSTLVPADIKDDWRKATQFLQGELGEGFFTYCGNFHAVHHMINGGDEGQVRKFIEWVNVLQTLKESDSNYPLLLKKLVSKNKSKSEAMPFIEIGRKHLREGFAVYFPKENQTSKNHDITLTYYATQEKIFVEVSRLNDTKDRADQHEQYNAVFNVIQDYAFDLHVAGKLKKSMNKATLAATLQKIKDLKDQAWTTKRIASLVDENISIAFVTNSCFEELGLWCIANDASKGFNGLPVNFNDTQRIIRQNRIKKEAKQIQNDKPGILYFPIQIMYMMMMNKADSIIAFADSLKHFPNIIGMVLYSEVIGGIEKECFLDFGHIYSVQKGAWHVYQHVLFIENLAFNVELSDEARQAMKRALI